MRRALFVVLAAVFVVSMTCDYAVAKRGEVKIRVLDVDSKGREARVAGAEVQIWDASGAIVATAVTDEDGCAVVTGLEPKTEYTARALAPDGKQGTSGLKTNGNGGAGLVRVQVALP